MIKYSTAIAAIAASEMARRRAIATEVARARVRARITLDAERLASMRRLVDHVPQVIRDGVQRTPGACS